MPKMIKHSSLRKPRHAHDDVVRFYNGAAGGEPAANPGQDAANAALTKMLSEHSEKSTAAFAALMDGKLKEFEQKLGKSQRRSIDALREGASVAINAGTGQVMVAPGEREGIGCAALFRALALSHKTSTPFENVLKDWSERAKAAGDDDGAELHATYVQAKSLQAQNAAGAGILVPEVLYAGITELLRAAVIVETLPIRRIDMPNGNLTITDEATSMTATYGAELANITPSQGSLGNQKLIAKKEVGLVPISNDLIEYANGDSANMWVRDQIVRTFAVRKDLGLIRDDGQNETMKGLRWSALPANVVARSTISGSVTLETVNNDLQDCISRLEQLNIPMVAPAWLMSPRTKNFLMKLLNGLGLPIFADEMATRGTLKGYPFKVSTNIPNDLGSGGDESELYLFDSAQLVLGDARSLTIAISTDGSYTSGATTYNAFQRDETLIRGIASHDMLLRFRGNEVTVVKSLDWY